MYKRNCKKNKDKILNHIECMMHIFSLRDDIIIAAPVSGLQSTPALGLVGHRPQQQSTLHMCDAAVLLRFPSSHVASDLAAHMHHASCSPPHGHIQDSDCIHDDSTRTCPSTEHRDPCTNSHSCLSWCEWV